MAIKFGISAHEGDYVESVGTEETIEVATLRGSKGVTKVVHDYDPTKKFNLKTRGEESSLEVGVGNPGITGITGGVTVIESIKYDETNTDFPSAEVSGTNYPDAVVVSSGGGGGGGEGGGGV